MQHISGKKIILGISGGIAAYKTASFVRLLIKAGAEVQVIMSPASCAFITPLTLATLSKRPVYSQFEKNFGEWTNHVELGLWADLMIIAPATANTLAKMANGLCDNLLLATYLSAKCPVFFAPAMDLDMFQHPANQKNIHTLKRYGNIEIEAGFGELASGLVGKGRMAEPEEMLQKISDFFLKDTTSDLKGKKILITAGPTYEPIDPVRFIGNHSTGKMGFDIANEAAKRGAEVLLITGPTSLKTNNPAVQVKHIVSANDMYQACHEAFQTADIVIGAAAIADYRPKTIASQKIKKSDEEITIVLEKNPDILASLGAVKKHQFLVGFALETENEIEYAKGKLKKKNLDLIVLNSLNDHGAGFGKPTNKVTFIDKDFNIFPQELKSKEAVAKDIIDQIVKNYAE
ncbi:bifunctional phosphopantothenoylcysteine decarboxylase/phosphopantothenate--cysteine ligase CoaBC [Flavobacterium sp. CBA20B-1]|uniref:bifunctional phosphopantothenoylcysteine decarboxylase/phosphopantothenate--cysteine ligase CoaBC n=1 Tax=unclassified Flavobacterium TaxID=196869 RepID=UPI002224C930|nr:MULTISPECIES: bifunctional phosphopantothenoylcysteine decarboxylase/phosphopantothenate--cysteine ligase CoaBC [unclassified Flavobacterium]WCM41994.1 bifunctional phosphopantothenoylcysteine decarboxylase/phosphopantothenate--cysteine ligase CoaBC [Flavobacterium sp. CBA20B-1]